MNIFTILLNMLECFHLPSINIHDFRHLKVARYMNDHIKFSEGLIPDKAANKLSQPFTFQHNVLLLECKHHRQLLRVNAALILLNRSLILHISQQKS